ncbi:MAG: hypothetical protein Tsb0020_12080 [Haliangiales bacterium]
MLEIYSIPINNLLGRYDDPNADPRIGPSLGNTNARGTTRMADAKEEWLNRMTEMLAVDPEDLLEIAGMFFETIEERIDSIEASGRTGDLDTMTRLAHGLKGDAANIGFVDVAAVARDLEHQGRKQEVTNLEEQVASLRKATRAMQTSLDL